MAKNKCLKKTSKNSSSLKSLNHCLVSKQHPINFHRWHLTWHRFSTCLHRAGSNGHTLDRGVGNAFRFRLVDPCWCLAASSGNTSSINGWYFTRDFFLNRIWFRMILQRFGVFCVFFSCHLQFVFLHVFALYSDGKHICHLLPFSTSCCCTNICRWAAFLSNQSRVVSEPWHFIQHNIPAPSKGCQLYKP